MALVPVSFEWSDEHGFCYACGLPAAYALPELYGDVPDEGPYPPHTRRCSVCAAFEAAEGGCGLVYLFAEPVEDESPETEDHDAPN